MSTIKIQENDFAKMLTEFLTINGNKFVNLTYRNKQGELSNYLLMVGVDLLNSYKKDIKRLEKIVPNNDVEKQALSELITSMQNSVDTNFKNEDYTKLDYYKHLNKNVKIHDTAFYLNAFVLKKQIIESGQPKKPVKSAPKTIAKNKFKHELRVSKFREFKIDLNSINKASINGKKLEIVTE